MRYVEFYRVGVVTVIGFMTSAAGMFLEGVHLSLWLRLKQGAFWLRLLFGSEVEKECYELKGQGMCIYIAIMA